MPIYVLWIPCLEDELTIRERKISNYNISDTDISLIDAEINDTWHIIISYQYDGKEQKIVLVPYRPPRGGFLYYTLYSQTEFNTRLAQSLQEKFHQGLYHIIKSFFHKHVHHPKEEDSILHARFYKSEEELLAETKNDGEFYVEEYIKKFTFLSNDIVDCLNEISLKERTEWQRIINYLNIYSAYKRLTDKLSRYEGEYLYYQSLRKSVGSTLRNATAYDRRMSLLDKEIRIKLHQAENAFNYNSSVIGTNVSSLGLGISIISLILAVYIAWIDRSDEQLQLVNEQIGRIDEKVDIQTQSVTDKFKQLEMTFGDVDSLNDRIGDQDTKIDLLNQQNKQILYLLNKQKSQ